MKQKFYFTYGTDESQPFFGGWTEVHAEDDNDARRKFVQVHPLCKRGFLNCAFVYDHERFAKTGMASRGNFGKFTQEVIE